jgi:hypothetical protein
MTHQQLNEAYWYYVEIGGGGLEVVPSAAAKALLPMREAVEGLGESMTYAEAKAMAAELDESIDLGE